MMEVARRLQVPLDGVSFPGHFLLRTGPADRPGGPDFINYTDREARSAAVIDPFTGKALAPGELRHLLLRMGGEDRPLTVDSPELQPVTKNAILTRMLNNLRGIYTRSTRAEDAGRLQLTMARLRVLITGPDRPFPTRAGLLN